MKKEEIKKGSELLYKIEHLELDIDTMNKGYERSISINITTKDAASIIVPSAKTLKAIKEAMQEELDELNNELENI